MRVGNAVVSGTYPYGVSRVRFFMLPALNFVHIVAWRHLCRLVLLVFVFCWLLFVEWYVPFFFLSCRIAPKLGGDVPGDSGFATFTYFAVTFLTFPSFVDYCILFCSCTCIYLFSVSQRHDMFFCLLHQYFWCCCRDLVRVRCCISYFWGFLFRFKSVHRARLCCIYVIFVGRSDSLQCSMRRFSCVLRVVFYYWMFRRVFYMLQSRRYPFSWFRNSMFRNLIVVAQCFRTLYNAGVAVLLLFLAVFAFLWVPWFYPSVPI